MSVWRSLLLVLSLLLTTSFGALRVSGPVWSGVCGSGEDSCCDAECLCAHAASSCCELGGESEDTPGSWSQDCDCGERPGSFTVTGVGPVLVSTGGETPPTSGPIRGVREVASLPTSLGPEPAQPPPRRN